MHIGGGFSKKMDIFYTKTHEENRSKFVGSFQMGGESDTGDGFLVRETKFKMTKWVSCCGQKIPNDLESSNWK